MRMPTRCAGHCEILDPWSQLISIEGCSVSALCTFGTALTTAVVGNGMPTGGAGAAGAIGPATSIVFAGFAPLALAAFTTAVVAVFTLTTFPLISCKDRIAFA